MTESESNDSEYDRISDGYGEFYNSPTGRIYLAVTVNQIKEYADTTDENIDILDLGCGKCTVSRELASEMNVRRVDAIDSSREMVDDAQTLLSESDVSEFTVKCADITSHDYQRQYDLVLAQGGVMSHLDAPYDIFDVVLNTLNDNGCGFLSVITSYRYAIFSLWEGNWTKFKKLIRDKPITTLDNVTINPQRINKIKEYIEEIYSLNLVNIYPKVSYLGYIPAERQREMLSQYWDDIKEAEITAAKIAESHHGLQTEVVVEKST